VYAIYICQLAAASFLIALDTVQSVRTLDAYKYADECVLIVLERVSRSAVGAGGGERDRVGKEVAAEGAAAVV
jgi:hypothetical protein